ncbi:hypothetical protein ABT324_31270 [Saccharopolyspora sp. NPDC000359]|uniref:hypothetical protein n=1 Tax=Saccharopolyspora sp. NPDC000359 TaxID=3154251 RepID=UPI003333A6F8
MPGELDEEIAQHYAQLSGELDDETAHRLLVELADNWADVLVGALFMAFTTHRDQSPDLLTRARELPEERVRGKAVGPRDPLALTDPVRARQVVAHLLQPSTPLPADTGPFPFQTAIDNQRMAEIEVWEQARPTPSEELADNTKVGHGMLTGIPARPAGCRSELTVHARELETGNDVRFELNIGGADRRSVAAARTTIADHTVSW